MWPERDNLQVNGWTCTCSSIEKLVQYFYQLAMLFFAPQLREWSLTWHLRPIECCFLFICVYVKVNGSVFVRNVHLYGVAASKASGRPLNGQKWMKDGHSYPRIQGHSDKDSPAATWIKREGERNGSALWLITYETFFFFFSWEPEVWKNPFRTNNRAGMGYMSPRLDGRRAHLPALLFRHPKSS